MIGPLTIRDVDLLFEYIDSSFALVIDTLNTNTERELGLVI